MLDVEQPLVQGQLEAIDAQLRKAEESLNWNSQGQIMRHVFVFFGILIANHFSYVSEGGSVR